MGESEISDTSADAEVWLVKSSGRLLGPWNHSQIESALRSREIVPLDEIAPPYQRWRYIRDERVFDPIISELRSKRGPVEVTQTNTNTETSTEITERVYQFASDSELTAGLSDQLKDAKPVIESIRSQPVHVSSKVYEFEGPKSKSFSSTQYLIWVGLLLFAGALTYQVFTKTQKQGEALVGKTFPETLQFAKALADFGMNAEAIAAYREAYEMKKDSEEARLGLGMALSNEGQTTEARPLLEASLAATSLDNPKKALAALSLANAALTIDDFSSAKKLIEEGRALSSADPYLKIAQAHVLLNESKFKDSSDLIRQALDFGIIDPTASLLLAESEYLGAREGQIEEGYTSALSLLSNLAGATEGFRQEALALKIHIMIESKQILDLEDVATQLLDSDPRPSEDYNSSPRIFSGRSSWEHLQRYLKRSLAEVPATPRLTAVLGYSMFRGREKLEGKRVIEDAFAKNPGDRLIRAVLSFVQAEIGREDEAQAGLTIALEDRSLSLPVYLKALACRQIRDSVCTDEMLRQLLERDPKDVFALSGMAWLMFEAGKASDARKFLERGLMISPRYRPLLQLKMKMDNRL